MPDNQTRDIASVSCVPCLREKDRVVWRVSIPNKDDRYMAISGAFDQPKYIVLVRGREFYRIWRSGNSVREEGGQSWCPGLEEMANDYKFHYAEEGFSFGLANPVPLACINVEEISGEPIVWFQNGFTRTLWLLYNDAAIFPIGTHDVNSARLLQNAAGVVGQRIITVAALLEGGNA